MRCSGSCCCCCCCWTIRRRIPSSSLVVLVVLLQMVGMNIRPSSSFLLTAETTKHQWQHRKQLQRQLQQHHGDIAATKSTRITTPFLVLYMGNDGGNEREEEIARLQEQIRKLQQEGDGGGDGKPQESLPAVTGEDDLSSSISSSVQDTDTDLLEDAKTKNMLLTEGDLIEGGIFDDDSNNETGGIIPAVAGAVLAAVVIALFSQVPVGQDDLSRYSAPTGPTTSTRIDLGDLNPDSSKK